MRLTGATIDGTQITLSTNTSGLVAHKILDLPTPYAEADLQNIRILQDGNQALLLLQERRDYPACRRFLHQRRRQRQPACTRPPWPPQSFMMGRITGHPLRLMDRPLHRAHSAVRSPSRSPRSPASTAAPASHPPTSAASSASSRNPCCGPHLHRLYDGRSIVKDADVYWTAVANSTGVEPHTGQRCTHWVINIDGGGRMDLGARSRALAGVHIGLCFTGTLVAVR